MTEYNLASFTNRLTKPGMFRPKPILWIIALKILLTIKYLLLKILFFIKLHSPCHEIDENNKIFCYTILVAIILF